MKCILILCCEGRQDNNFHFCSGVSNVILDFETIRHTQNYKQLVEYIDRVPKLFDSPCFNNNTITNVMYKLFEWSYISEELYKRITDFYTFHRRCGLIIKIEAK